LDIKVASALGLQDVPATATHQINRGLTSLHLGAHMSKGLTLSNQRTCQSGETTGALTPENKISSSQTKMEDLG